MRQLNSVVEVSTLQVNEGTKQLNEQTAELIRVKQQQDKLHQQTAPKKLLLECIEKT